MAGCLNVGQDPSSNIACYEVVSCVFVVQGRPYIFNGACCANQRPGASHRLNVGLRSSHGPETASGCVWPNNPVHSIHTGIQLILIL